jgi:hypothetical protein
MIGSLLIGKFVGLITCIGLIISGASFWWAVAAYSVSGMVAALAAAVFSGYVRDAQNVGPPSRFDERENDLYITPVIGEGARIHAPSRYVPTAQASRPNVSSYEP